MVSIPSEVAKIKHVLCIQRSLNASNICYLHPVSDLSNLARRNSKTRYFNKKISENENIGVEMSIIKFFKKRQGQGSYTWLILGVRTCNGV